MPAHVSLLHGQSLSWVTYDPSRTVSAALRWMLRESFQSLNVRLEITEAANVEESATLVEQHRAGLLTLVLAEADWPGACKALRRVQLRRNQCLRCVYVTVPELDDDLRVLEAGAQIVVDQIPWLQQLVPRIVQHAPRRAGGNHPITMGLIDRLPWTRVT